MNKPFISAVHESLGVDGSSDYHVPVSWDAAHYLNLAVLDVRDGKKGFVSKEHFQRFVARSNIFSLLMGRGKNFSLLKAVAREKKLSLHMPVIYAVQR